MLSSLKLLIIVTISREYIRCQELEKENSDTKIKEPFLVWCLKWSSPPSCPRKRASRSSLFLGFRVAPPRESGDHASLPGMTIESCNELLRQDTSYLFSEGGIEHTARPKCQFPRDLLTLWLSEGGWG